MTLRIRITAGTVVAKAVLNDTSVAEKVWAALPVELQMHSWGGELYGSTLLDFPEEKPQEVVSRGDLAYGPLGRGHALCIFFGPTPASVADEPRAAAGVTVFGKVEGDFSQFFSVKSGTRVRFERA